MPAVASASARQRVDERRADEQLDGGGRNGRPGRAPTAIAGSSSRFVRARIARRRRRRRRPRPSSDRARSRTASSAASRREDDRPGAPRPGADRLGEPLAVVLDEPDRAPRRPSPGSGSSRRGRPAAGPAARRRGQDAPDVGQPPAVDRLVVVADEEDPVRRRGEQQGQPELGPVEVLGLVDEQVRAALAPAREDAGVALEQAQAARDEVVEVEPALAAIAASYADERPRGRARRPGRPRPRRRVDAEVELQPRERRVERAASRPARPPGATCRRTPSGRASGSTAAPASRRISSPSAWNVRTPDAAGPTSSGSSAAVQPLAAARPRRAC